jgi:hypothetical protein
LEDQPVDLSGNGARGRLEDEYRRTMPVGSAERTAPADFSPTVNRQQGLEHWEQIEHQMIALT